MSGQNLAWKDFGNRMKEKHGGGKRKSYTDLKNYFTSLPQNRFQESCQNRNKSTLQKICICNLSSNDDLASRGSYLFNIEDRRVLFEI